MSPYDTPAALREALEARLRTQSLETGVDLQRLQRRAAFERLLVRLETAAPGRWILKGGMALEVRLGDRARSTKDLDLAVRLNGQEARNVRELLIDCLAADPEGDGFDFLVGAPRNTVPDEAGRAGWSFPVDIRLAGRTFAAVRVEVVARADEISKTQRVALANALAFAGFAAHEVELVDPAQHFAEKLHAYTRDYGERPNSRTRDLPDLVLLIEHGLEPTSDVLGIVERLFAARATHPLPSALPDPPAGWQVRYAGLADELDISAGTIDEAMVVLRDFWRRTLATRPEEPHDAH